MNSAATSRPRQMSGYKLMPRGLWNRLGFGHCSAAKPDELDERPEFAPGWVNVHTVAVLDWRDRLRVLVSGRVMVDQAVKTDVVVRRTHATSAFSVLPPRCTWKTVHRYDQAYRCYRLGRLMWERGAVGDGKGYSVKLSVALRPVLFSWIRESDGWLATVLGVRLHYRRSYGGRFV